MSGTTLYIKNMVCDRCKMAVDTLLRQHDLTPRKVDLGRVDVAEDVSDQQRQQLGEALKALGFELLDDRRRQTAELIKAAIIKLVHHTDDAISLNLSAILAAELNQDYSALSKLFSEQTSTTIERYYMEQRVEYVKELLSYGELTLTEIALRMNYSSVAYLSSQFKNVTGMSPRQFKQSQQGSRKALDSI